MKKRIFNLTLIAILVFSIVGTNSYAFVRKTKTYTHYDAVLGSSHIYSSVAVFSESSQWLDLNYYSSTIYNFPLSHPVNVENNVRSVASVDYVWMEIWGGSDDPVFNSGGSISPYLLAGQTRTFTINGGGRRIYKTSTNGVRFATQYSKISGSSIIDLEVVYFPYSVVETFTKSY